MVYFWSFILFWCGIEEWFFVSLSVTVGADTAIFSFLSIIEQCFFFEWSPLTVGTSPVGSAACTCTSQRVLALWTVTQNRVAASFCLVVDRPTAAQSG